VVEPDDGARSALVATLSARGCRVLEARSGEEGVEVAGGVRTDLVVLSDLVLPDLGHVDFARRLQAACPGARLLLSSFHPRDDLVARGVLAPDSPYLRRPYGPDDLAQAVHDAATRPNSGSSAG
jgi:CheY-like chemotaxis protein